MDTIKFSIRSRYDDSVLYEADIPADTPSGLQARVALEKATAARANLARANLAGANLAWANLDGANLDGANLDGANLARANLDGANLARANLAGANLARANLAWANLAGANLAGAYLAWAYLDGANLAWAKLIGERPVFQIGPIGSRCSYFVAYLTDAGVKVKAGCFTGTLDEFRVKLQDTHDDNNHAEEYRAALTLIECHAKLWGAA